MEVLASDKFKKDVGKTDNTLRLRLEKQIIKIKEKPLCGKPLRGALKGTRSLRVKPYRLLYAIGKDKIILLRFEHRRKVY